MQESEIKEVLAAAFPDAEMRLQDLTGGGDHWRLVISSSAFRDRTMLQQHQLVYQALGDLMKAKIHALSLDTVVK